MVRNSMRGYVAYEDLTNAQNRAEAAALISAEVGRVLKTSGAGSVRGGTAEVFHDPCLMAAKVAASFDSRSWTGAA